MRMLEHPGFLSSIHSATVHIGYLFLFLAKVLIVYGPLPIDRFSFYLELSDDRKQKIVYSPISIVMGNLFLT